MPRKDIRRTFYDKIKPTVPEKIKFICQSLAEVLIEKNKRYGNSAIQPLKIFNKGDTDNSINIRIDDKLSRIKNGDELRKNDVADLMGYLVLKCVEQNWFDFKDQID